jgi:hypothetical protein
VVKGLEKVREEAAATSKPTAPPPDLGPGSRIPGEVATPAGPGFFPGAPEATEGGPSEYSLKERTEDAKAKNKTSKKTIPDFLTGGSGKGGPAGETARSTGAGPEGAGGPGGQGPALTKFLLGLRIVRLRYLEVCETKAAEAKNEA